MGQDTVTAITFQQVQKLVKQGRVQDSKLVDAVDKLAGVILLLSGVTIAKEALSLLGAKNEITKLGQAAAKKLLNRDAGDFLDRSRRMTAAHCLLTYTAFFTALDRHAPDLMAVIALTDAEKLNLLPDRGLINSPVVLPHPVHSETANRRFLYLTLASRFQHFAKGLNHQFRERDLTEAIESAGRAAEEVYQAQYLELLRDSPDFTAWVGRQDQHRIDRGLQDLADRIAELHPGAQSDATAADLSTVYGHRLADPVFGDHAQADGLVFPAKQDAFIPQAFKVIRNQTSDTNLEHEPRWSDLPIREDLGDFLLEFLHSPYSTQTPLLVLGHPGSGKSLLTEVLAARLAAPAFTAVRIELRDINPETDFQDQLETQIKRDTGRTVNWSEFARSRADSPPLIILDGYDELLQANGKVFADYLMRAAAFQSREAMLGRPVRILITSRITLIDKATLPADTTVIRLLEFDRPRQELWADTWNTHNARPFTVPESPALLELAEQPLLLLMLAIYDATVKPLSNAENLERTELYYSLLTEFIRRERRKDPTDPSPDVTAELNRLGVAAIGMFNRQAVHILSAELDADLAYFTGAHTPDGPGRRLTQAELLVGSFFFIHESRGQVDAKAYEFLHNTFGEFLAADFLLRQVIRETTTVAKLSGDEALHGALEAHLATLSPQWFACLKHVPLHSRPQMVRLLREWARGRVDTEALDRILHHQLRAIVYSPDALAYTARHDGDPYPRNALLAQQATYTLNLVVLRTALANDRYELHEQRIGPPDLYHGTWDRLTHLWRAWFSLDALGMLASLLTAIRLDSTVTLSLWPVAGNDIADHRLDLVLRSAEALADHLTIGLAGKAILGPTGLEYAESNLAVAGVALPQEFAVLRGRRDPAELHNPDWFPDDIRLRSEHVYAAFDILQRTPGPFTVPHHGIRPEQLTNLSRAEAATIIDFLVRFDPSWLAVITDSAVGLDPLLLEASPMVAPLLNAYARHGDQEVSFLAEQVAAGFGNVGDLDAETAVAFAAFADAGGQPDLRRSALTALVDDRASNEPLLALPQPALDELVSLLVTGGHADLAELRPAITDRLARESAYLDQLTKANPPEILLRLSQAARIADPHHVFTGILFQKITARVHWRQPWPGSRYLLRAVREQNQHEDILRQLCPRDTPVLLGVGLTPLHRYRDELTFQDIDDLLWAAPKIGGKAAHEQLLAELREHGLR
ncbi:MULTISPECIES: NACHT domain-containing NTPase [unclassified Crossiella]|uniref:NACHT domain-containing protein n=1 Tax=unclassified Crossiella TaxID=2620835 RepID=UPI001FFEB66C|nr:MULTISPECIES: ATP-binding protein [unclassified Crossiella]MCK2243109.1 ATP-binding protein [Crossiella sp. S99.2]MCK2256986.1 ATP-binding protein [Crossiella sp. S99.1]